ncbi:hypothetical protein [Myxosarcina sp. GI1]|uniref:hypothetical protein n=1 Tax=Myxosarcina sp. GI1 TaxID=1541065 RepID=UPI00055B02D0|nr:hypothetical protein [Myxosarcina sp. GI1]
MTYDNNYFANGIEDLPPSGIDAVSRSRITGYTPTEPNVIDTGTEQIESPTIKDIMAQREDNPFLRLGVIGGVMGIICLFLWGIFAFLSPDTPIEVVEEVETEETVEAEPDYKAQLAFRDQFHSLEKKPEPQIEQATNDLPPATKPESLPPTQPVAQPVPRPAAPRPVPRSTYRPAPKPVIRPIPYAERYPLGQPVPAATKPEIPPQEQWLALANFGTGVSSRPIPQPSVKRSNTSATNLTPTPALLVNNSVSQGELGILNRRRINSKGDRLTPAVTIDRGIVKGKIELPLVWDSSLTPEQQQSNQITVVLEEPIYDIEDKTIFDRGSVAIVEVQSINDTNGLVTAYVSHIDNTTFKPGELILRNQKKSALVAKASKRSDFGNRLLVGGVNTLSSFGQQILIPETNSTVSNGTAIVTSQSRNSIGRDLAGSALDGFGSSLSSELEQRSNRNQIGDGGTIFTLAQNTTVYLTNIKPLKINH